MLLIYPGSLARFNTRPRAPALPRRPMPLARHAISSMGVDVNYIGPSPVSLILIDCHCGAARFPSDNLEKYTPTRTRPSEDLLLPRIYEARCLRTSPRDSERSDAWFIECVEVSGWRKVDWNMSESSC